MFGQIHSNNRVKLAYAIFVAVYYVFLNISKFVCLDFLFNSICSNLKIFRTSTLKDDV